MRMVRGALGLSAKILPRRMYLGVEGEEDSATESPRTVEAAEGEVGSATESPRTVEDEGAVEGGVRVMVSVLVLRLVVLIMRRPSACRVSARRGRGSGMFLAVMVTWLRRCRFLPGMKAWSRILLRM